LHENDQIALTRLCSTYNALRTLVISSQEHHQELLDDVEARVALAIDQLDQLRLDVTECLKLAAEEIHERGSMPTNNAAIYSPRYFCDFGNSSGSCRSFFYSLVCL
jgi:hypothetical protein